MRLICHWSACALVTLAASGVYSSHQLTSALPLRQLMALSRCGLSLTSLVSEYVTTVALLAFTVLVWGNVFTSVCFCVTKNMKYNLEW